MKKTLLSILASLLLVFGYAQMDTLIGFSFPVNSGVDSLHPTSGLPVNLTTPIVMISDVPSMQEDITLTNGVYASGGTDYAATSEGWDSSANNKYWMIELSTLGYANLLVYSAQRSGGNNPGPKYFIMQYRVGTGGTWTDFGPDTIEVANNWTAGIVDSVSIPSATWNSAEIVYLRWMSITNESSSGGQVDTVGVSKIDEIYVLGTVFTSIDESDLAYNVYPNPCNGQLNIDTRIDIEMVHIISLDGRLVQTIAEPGNTLDLSALDPGLYFLRFETNETSVTRKIILE